MLIPKLFFIFIFFSFLSSCPFDDNRKIEKLLAESEIKFHSLYNQEKFQEIYEESDDELKNKFNEQQFISYLEVSKNETGNIETKPIVWIDDELKDRIKRVLFKRTRFFNVELTSTERAIYREKFEWNLMGNEVKIASYQIEKLCNKPCQLNIKTK